MENLAYRCPKCGTKVTRLFCKDETGQFARWWSCENGHFFGTPHWQSEWEDPSTAPLDPDLEPWSEGSPWDQIVGTFDQVPRFVMERPARLTLRQFLGRGVVAVALGCLSIILSLHLLIGPHIRKLPTTMI